MVVREEGEGRRFSWLGGSVSWQKETRVHQGVDHSRRQLPDSDRHNERVEIDAPEASSVLAMPKRL
jgi:hypothetical protein